MRTRDQIWKAISALDLRPIIFKLTDSDHGKGWSPDRAEKAELKYRQFLFLSGIYTDEIIVPSKDIDEFWHLHILDTKKYLDDCLSVFGYFLHHFPYFGLRGAEDLESMHSAFERSIHLHDLEFPDSEVGYTDTSDTSGKTNSSLEPSICGGGGGSHRMLRLTAQGRPVTLIGEPRIH
jgi:hypothetical protein